MADGSEIRAWAAAHGMTVGETGKLPAAVREAYAAAHPGPGDDEGEPGPDFGQAAGAETAEPDESEPEPPAGPPAASPAGTGPSPVAGGEGPPPPASLEEARDRLGGDRGKAKRPGWAAAGLPRRGAKTRPAAQPRRPVTATKALTGEMEARLALLLSIPASTWALLDPVCGGAAADNLDNIVRKSVPLMIQSPQIVAWFTKGQTFMLWLDLAIAVQPVAQAVYAHHVAGSVMAVDGQVVPARRGPDGRLHPAEPIPAGPPPDFSRYTTQVSGHIPQPRPA